MELPAEEMRSETAELTEPRQREAVHSDRVEVPVVETEDAELRESPGREDESPGSNYGIRVRMVTPYGAPLLGLCGTAKISHYLMSARSVGTDEEGYLFFKDDRPSEVFGRRKGSRLSVRLAEPSTCWAAEVDLSPAWTQGGQEDLGDLVAEGHPFIASGQVLLESGSPAAGADVAVYRLSDEGKWRLPEAMIVGALSDGLPSRYYAHTDALGRFTVYAKLDARESTQLVANYPGYVASSTVLAPGASTEDLRFELQQGAGVQGKLMLDALLPSGKVTVEVVDCESGDVLFRPFVRGEVDGLFPFVVKPMLTPTWVRLVVRIQSSFELMTLDSFELKPGETTDVGVLDATGRVQLWHIYPYTDAGPAHNVHVSTLNRSAVRGWSYGSCLADAGLLVCTQLPPPIEVTLRGAIVPQTLTLTADEREIFVEVEPRALPVFR